MSTNLSGDVESNSIDRSAGKCVAGFMTGAGFRGKREDQDAVVREFARRLDEMFPHDVEIRYNTDQLKGGAWLVDDHRSAQVGLGAALTAPEWYVDQRERARWADADEPKSLRYLDPDELVLRYTVKLTHPAVDEPACNRHIDRDDRASYVFRKFRSMEAAWGFFQTALNREQVNEPTDP